MSTMSRFSQVNELCEHFDDCQSDVEEKKVTATAILHYLSNYTTNNFFIKGSEFVGVGSSYEDTAVSPDADFDIAMILPAPFTMDYFECVQTEEPGLFKLKCTNLKPTHKNYLNNNKFLIAERLRNAVFAELTRAFKNKSFENHPVVIEKLNSCLTVNCSDVHLDIAPEIKSNAKHVPGWRGIERLPRVVQEYMNKNEDQVLFNISCKHDFMEQNYHHLAVQPAFNLLEKVAMEEGPDVIRYSVCIAKAISKLKKNKWSKDGLRSFHIKRVALILWNEILQKNDPWYGFQLIMDKLVNMLKMGKIEGYFLKNHDITCTDLNDCRTLADKITKVLQSLTPNNILEELDIEN